LRRQLRIAGRGGELVRLQEPDMACGYREAADRELLPHQLRMSA